MTSIYVVILLYCVTSAVMYSLLRQFHDLFKEALSSIRYVTYNVRLGTNDEPRGRGISTDLF